jgi:hypothetical protein
MYYDIRNGREGIPEGTGDLDFRNLIYLTLATRDEGCKGKLARHEMRPDKGKKGIEGMRE